MLLRLKRYLKAAYGLTSAKCQSYRPNEGTKVQYTRHTKLCRLFDSPGQVLKREPADLSVCCVYVWCGVVLCVVWVWKFNFDSSWQNIINNCETKPGL